LLAIRTNGAPNIRMLRPRHLKRDGSSKSPVKGCRGRRGKKKAFGETRSDPDTQAAEGCHGTQWSWNFQNGQRTVRHQIFRRPVSATDRSLLDNLRNVLKTNIRGTKCWDSVQETKGGTCERHLTNSDNDAPSGKKRPSSQSTTGYGRFDTPNKSENGDSTPDSPKKAQGTEDYRELRRENSARRRQPLHQRLTTTASPPLFTRKVRGIPHGSWDRYLSPLPMD